MVIPIPTAGKQRGGSTQNTIHLQRSAHLLHIPLPQVHAHDLPSPVVLVLHHLEHARFERWKLLLLHLADHRVELITSGKHADPTRIHRNPDALAHKPLKGFAVEVAEPSDH
ncbi:hypothetical protein MRB53_009757 [Persea americana]|uniref:Uncharacterized protein n=1 Tax=Persea americana TaxID=3435 RepID=A0ACC2LPW2_PERAE|nr:hypothetical protein MRB53_009757 [Persea americana]